MATAQQVIDLAIQRASLNNADLVPPAQLLRYISQAERFAYLAAGRLDTDYFGKDGVTTVRSTFTGVWDLAAAPGDIGMLTRAEVQAIVGTVAGLAVGTQVNLIGIRWPDLDVSPRAVVRGRKVIGYKVELGAADLNMVSQLKVFYSPVPPLITVVQQVLSLPDEWTDLVVLPLARILALRDRRIDEVPAIDEEMKAALELFSQAVLSFGHGVRRPLPNVPAIPLVQTRGQAGV